MGAKSLEPSIDKIPGWDYCYSNCLCLVIQKLEMAWMVIRIEE